MNVEDRAGLIGGLCLRCSTHRVEFAAPSYDVPCVSWFVCHVCWFYIHLCHFPPSFHYHFTHIFAAPNPSQSPLRFPTEMAKWNAPHLAKFSRDSLKFHHFNQTWCFFEGLPKSTQIPYHFFPFPSFFLIHPHPKNTPSLPKPTLVRCGEPGGEGLGHGNIPRDPPVTAGEPPAVPSPCRSAT